MMSRTAWSRSIGKAFDLLVLSLAGAVALSACRSTEPARPEVARTATDQESTLVQAAALDFLGSGQCKERIGTHGIMVATTTTGSVAYLSDEWLQDNLPPDIWMAAEPLLNTFRATNAQIFLMDWRLTSQDIVIGDTSNADYLSIREDKHAKCIAWFAVPTVAADGESALVMFDVGPEYHGRTVLYVMRRSANGWLPNKSHIFEFL